jgi:hypothetical protein
VLTLSLVTQSTLRTPTQLCDDIIDIWLALLFLNIDKHTSFSVVVVYHSQFKCHMKHTSPSSSHNILRKLVILCNRVVCQTAAAAAAAVSPYVEGGRCLIAAAADQTSSQLLRDGFARSVRAQVQTGVGRC